MATQELAAALSRVETCLRRRPELGRHDDAPAIARWSGGARVVTSVGGGMEVATDAPAELGGSGELVSPGCLFRASVAGCATTAIALTAARAGIELTHLEVQATSRSDVRGVLGLSDPQDRRVSPAPSEVTLSVRIGAANATEGQLRELVEEGCCCAPVPSAVRTSVPVSLDVAVVNG